MDYAVRQPFPDVAIPDISVWEYLFGTTRGSDADRIALVDAKSGEEATYREMIALADAFAGALADRGVGVGDVVGLLAPNSSAWVVAFHGVLRAGATVATINALFTAKDIAKQLTDSRAKMLITVTALFTQAADAATAAGLSEDAVVVLDGDGEAIDGHPNAAELLGQEFRGPRVTFDPRHIWPSCPTALGRPAIPRA